jgi:hypothetical protein
MKIKEASKKFIEGGIMFPSSKTSYIEANTQKGEEHIRFQHRTSHTCTQRT